MVGVGGTTVLQTHLCCTVTHGRVTGGPGFLNRSMECIGSCESFVSVRLELETKVSYFFQPGTQLKFLM
jgi:predicted metal-binding protein